MIAILLLVASALIMLWAAGEVLAAPPAPVTQLTPFQAKVWWFLAILLVIELIYLWSQI